MRLKTPPSNASNLVRFVYFGLFQLAPVMFTIAPVTVADPMPPPSAGSRKMQLTCTDAEVVGKIDQLLNTQTFSEIAATLNKNGFHSGKGQRFTPRYIARIQKQYVLRSRFDRLRALGLLTLNEMAGVLSVHPKTVKTWVAHGLLKAHAYTDKPEHLYEPLGPNMPRKAQGVKLCLRPQAASVLPQRSKEVQCESVSIGLGGSYGRL